jgi:splicing suppressor protein 51
MADTCATCNATAASKNLAALRLCSRCKTTRYCSRECQKTDWKTHKKACASYASAGASTEHSSTYSAPRLHDLEVHVPNPFTQLDRGTYLHSRPATAVYKLLIDSFRMRQADDFSFEAKTSPPSVYTGARDSVAPFRAYLAKAAALLPPWWTPAHAEEWVAFGGSGAWSDLKRKLTKQQAIEHYGDDKMSMQLRMLAEAVYGSGTMGQDGSGVRRMMAEMESGGAGEGQHMSMFNLAGMRA